VKFGDLGIVQALHCGRQRAYIALFDFLRLAYPACNPAVRRPAYFSRFGFQLSVNRARVILDFRLPFAVKEAAIGMFPRCCAS